MSAAFWLTQRIRHVIPLSEAMEFSIEHLEQDEIRVNAPLQPNINVHGTGFAGSLYSLAVLTGWALGTHILEEMAIDADLVVGRAEISYHAPVTGDFECHCKVSDTQRDAFLQRIREHGKGRLELDITVGDLPQATLHATYVAIAKS